MSCTGSGFLSAADARLKGRNDRLIFSEVCAIEGMILNALNNCTTTAPMSILVNGGTPLTSPHGIESISIVDGGADYIESAPTISVAGGTGFVGGIQTDGSTGEVLGISIDSQGSGYSLGDVVTITHAAGASGVPYHGEVSAIGNSGELLGIQTISGGSDYKNTPYLKIIDPQGTGSGFVGSITLDATTKSVLAVDILNSGNNYSENSAAIIVGDVQVGGVNAIITTKPQSSMFNGVNIDPTYYYKVWAGLIDDKPVKMQIDTIQKNFTDLGYNFIIKVNPSTMNTLMWYISW